MKEKARRSPLLLLSTEQRQYSCLSVVGGSVCLWCGGTSNLHLSLISHPSMLLFITHNSYCSFAVETQVPEPLNPNMTSECLRSECQNVDSLLGDINIVCIVCK